MPDVAMVHLETSKIKFEEIEIGMALLNSIWKAPNKTNKSDMQFGKALYEHNTDAFSNRR
jgi:hypothetical protein